MSSQAQAQGTSVSRTSSGRTQASSSQQANSPKIVRDIPPNYVPDGAPSQQAFDGFSRWEQFIEDNVEKAGGHDIIYQEFVQLKDQTDDIYYGLVVLGEYLEMPQNLVFEHVDGEKDRTRYDYDCRRLWIRTAQAWNLTEAFDTLAPAWFNGRSVYASRNLLESLSEIAQVATLNVAVEAITNAAERRNADPNGNVLPKDIRRAIEHLQQSPTGTQHHATAQNTHQGQSQRRSERVRKQKALPQVQEDNEEIQEGEEEEEEEEEDQRPKSKRSRKSNTDRAFSPKKKASLSGKASTQRQSSSIVRAAPKKRQAEAEVVEEEEEEEEDDPVTSALKEERRKLTVAISALEETRASDLIPQITQALQEVEDELSL